MLNEKGQKINFQKKLDKILSEIDIFNQNNPKKSLLLHACCGPCSSYVLEYLVKYFDITIFYYNPNIYPQEEYIRRFEELKRLYTTFPPALEGKVKVVEKAYNPEDFYTAIGIREQTELAVEPEKGERCRRCYEFRLKATYDYACQNNFDYFCTTLSISPFKDADKLNIIGEELMLRQVQELQRGQTPKEFLDKRDRDKCSDNGDRDNYPKWLISDFKKNNGFKRSLEISEEYGMYRQDYCGCVYSKNNVK